MQPQGGRSSLVMSVTKPTTLAFSCRRHATGLFAGSAKRAHVVDAAAVGLACESIRRPHSAADAMGMPWMARRGPCSVCWCVVVVVVVVVEEAAAAADDRTDVLVPRISGQPIMCPRPGGGHIKACVRCKHTNCSRAQDNFGPEAWISISSYLPFPACARTFPDADNVHLFCQIVCTKWVQRM